MTDELPTTTLTNASFSTKMSLGTLRILCDGRRYEPQPDITPIELARMLVIFATFIGGGYYHYDYEAFIAEHGLERHWPKEGP